MQTRQHRQPTAQLSMIHSRNPPPTPFARRNHDADTATKESSSVLHTDENIASLYTGMSNHATHRKNSSLQQQPQQQRYYLDEDEIDPMSSGALQFVPAFAEADWSAILDEEEEKKESDIHHHTKSCVSLPGVASGAFRSQKDSRTSAYSSRCSRTAAKQQQQQQQLSNGRISRIKSMFSSRANVPASVTSGSRTTSAPPSPSHSSSGSSGFVGWPGTQDPNGKTVPLNMSSYDDSSAGPAKAHLAEELKRAEQQISQWTAQTSHMTGFDSIDSGFPSPIRPIDSSSVSSPTNQNKSVPDFSFLNQDHDDIDVDDDQHPQTPAEFHLAAAIADAQATENARRRNENDLSFGFTEFNHSFTENNDDALHQPVPFLRTKGRSLPSSTTDALANSSNRMRHRTHDESKNSSLKAASKQFRESANKSLDFDFNNQIYSGPVDLDDVVPNDDDNDGFDEVQKFNSGRSKQANTIAQRSRIQPPTEDALHLTEKFGPAHRNFATPTSKGFRGLLDKTKDVPCLMDNMDSDSMSSSRATSIISSGPSNVGGSNRDDLRVNRNVIHETMVRGNNSQQAEEDARTVSDVFDGISVSKESDVFDNLSFFTSSRRNGKMYTPSSYPERIAEEDEGRTIKQDDNGDDFKMVLLGGGLTAIQATRTNFSNRQTPSDYDDALTNSEVSSSGDVKIPGYLEMLSAGQRKDSSLHGIHGNFGTTPMVRKSYDETPHFAAAGSHCDSSNSGRSSLFTDPYRDEVGLQFEGDLSEYYVDPSQMKLVVRKYRSLSNMRSAQVSFSELEREEDEHKAFALFEMRSRIMEKDIERGLERRGGTSVVDDIVTTSYNRTAHRIRDAVIVSKAWRDGATIADVVNSALLTRRAERTFFMKRPVACKDNYNCKPYTFPQQRFTWEAVKWLDDTDIVQYRCPSLGSRHMRGFEIFTIGDCQSVLLKLTNERCMELRQKLNEATAKQISAEELLKEEGDCKDGLMTEAEMYYLGAMEEVKAISKKLVGAEQSFSLVRERIEKLISKYETILTKLEAESFAGASSVMTSSSYYSEYETSDFWEQDRERWARRARRAEIRAEIAAREALLAKQEIQKIQEEKIREVDALKRQLLELQSEASVVTAERERAAVARSLAVRRSNNSSAKSILSQQSTKLDSVKQRFRDRMAAKKQQSEGYRASALPSLRAPLYPQKQKPVLSAKAQAAREILRAAGEEMYQQMDFYERSLKAVDRSCIHLL